MSIKLLSLNDSDINEDELKSDLIPFVNDILLELYKIKKDMDDYKNMDMITKMELLYKFKLIVDIFRIYKNPEIISHINEYQKDKNKENNNNNQSRGFGNLFGDYWNFGSNDKSSDKTSDKISAKSISSESIDSDDIDSVVSEASYDQDKFNNMIDNANYQIYAKSTLRQILTIERFYKCGVADSDTESK